MDQLNIKLYKLFVKQLLDLNIGYDYNERKLNEMIDIIQMIDYIQYGNPSRQEIQKIIEIYGQA